ncbi:hypothetical protein VE02_09590 [Pseudogymnoascus sp. 03VT05]|nr:hypothetical protein VE02_09590 [Pseudogymnoascus sp. 03VT05]
MDIVKKAVKLVQVETEPGLTTAEMMLTNDDLRPVEPERRQWRWLNFVAFWIADSLNVNTWMITSSMLVDGLSWWQAWLCVWIGYSLSAVFVYALGRIGTIYHIPFAVANRASFGVWGSFWPVANRAVMAVVWFGVQTYLGGECVNLMIQSIWPRWKYIPNGIPASAGVTTQQFVGFFLFWLAMLPALWFPIYKIRHVFTVKAYFSPMCAIAFFGWAISRAHGLGPIVHQSNTATGSVLAWAVIKSIMSCIGNFAALIINNPDFARYARKPQDAIWSQLITIPVGFAITSFIGIIVTSSATVIYGQEVWNPLALLDMYLENATGAERFGVFVISTGFALAQLGTNIAANTVSAGTNLTALLPRFCTIRRGGYICAAIGLAMCPWQLVSSSSNFTTYLSAYSVFLCSIAGVMCSDYYLVRKGYLDLDQLYSADKNGAYYGICGVSWIGYTAYMCGLLINFVGFVGAIGVKVPIGATYIYNFNYFTGFIVSGAVYWLLSRFFYIPATSATWNEVKYHGAEQSAAEAKDLEAVQNVEDAKHDI